MKKLKLKIDELRIEQFQVEQTGEEARGTVRGLETSTCWCGGLSNANTEPCRFCPEMPITYSCNETECV